MKRAVHWFDRTAASQVHIAFVAPFSRPSEPYLASVSFLAPFKTLCPALKRPLSLSLFLSLPLERRWKRAATMRNPTAFVQPVLASTIHCGYRLNHPVASFFLLFSLLLLSLSLFFFTGRAMRELLAYGIICIFDGYRPDREICSTDYPPIFGFVSWVNSIVS